MKRIKLWVGAMMAVCLVVFATACKKDNYTETEGTCPTVDFTNPASNAVNVPLNVTLTVAFNQDMDPATITQKSFFLQGTTEIAGELLYDPTTFRLTFNPDQNLAPNKKYTATVTTSVKDLAGSALKTNYVWTFTTGSSVDVVVPEVVSTSPVDDATGILLSKVITATFSEPMNQMTVSPLSFTVNKGSSPVAGTVTYSGVKASFTPSAPLQPNTTYIASISIKAEDLAGNPMAASHAWNFKTGNVAQSPPVVALNSVARFGIIAGVGVSNNAGFSEIHNMDVGISPGVRSSITGFPPAIIVNGAIYASDDLAPAGIAVTLANAKEDLKNAYLFAEGASSPAPATVSGDIGGTTLTSGIYKSTSTLLIQSGDLTLDAQGDPNAVWIFQVASDFTTIGGAGGNVILAGGAQAKNVFWQTGSSATIGNFTSFKGNILALTSITMNPGATAEGRMLARNGSVVLTSTNIINKP